ncbi:unnamed protein product [Didymodactylos carnosus]|uniref:Uncharacterized protein n=1 Tax=Didymodactylos carnosus TaxID=1234261 RepID=A0A814H218_9BILA|nr:unnamed protein product [Didymodactylos carnosus]CAF3776081.1 unnamed protein product [Didymodactylos carnosus]
MENLLLDDNSSDRSDGTPPLNNRTSPDRDDELLDTEESGGYKEIQLDDVDDPSVTEDNWAVDVHVDEINISEDFQRSGYDLSADTWNKLSTVQSVLEIFVAATTTMSASSYPTVVIGLFFIRRIKAHLEPSTDTPMIKSLKQQLLSQMTYYFESDPEQFDALKLRA